MAVFPFSSTSAISTARAPRASLRILYADDLRELREITRLSFSRDGHAIECHPDAISGLVRITSDPDFDLVITDHHMPGMNGLQFVERLRELKFRGKIMVFSSELSGAVAMEYQKLEVDRILYKPVFPSTLRQAMAELFGW
jgi:two-component system, chemotaxis family, chemotaxis protein CheY